MNFILILFASTLFICVFANGEPEGHPSEEEIRAELYRLFTKYDENEDGKISKSEMGVWIKDVNDIIIKENIDRQWRFYEPVRQEVHSWQSYNPKIEEIITWDHFLNKTNPNHEQFEGDNSQRAEDWNRLIKRSEKRWKVCDNNNDTLLTKDEFKDFISPADSDKLDTRMILVNEALEDIDIDEDGEITLDEHMQHLISTADPNHVKDPQWIQNSQHTFTDYLDINKDGVLNHEELVEWLIPDAKIRFERESDQTIVDCDKNGDQWIDKTELLDNMEKFFQHIPPTFWSQFMAENELYKEESQHDEL